MSNIKTIFLSDLKRLFANVVSSIVIIGLVVMPSLFAWYNIIACWNVFDNTGNLEVAVANTDVGYQSDLIPIRVNVGEQVMSALRENDQIDWIFTDKDDAIDGTKSGKYYAAVVIPEDFSRDMLTFYSKDSDHAQISYYSNEKKSAIAPKITDRGADTVSYQVNQVFAETLSEISIALAQSLSKHADDVDAKGRLSSLSAHINTLSEQTSDAANVISLYGKLAESSKTLVDETFALMADAEEEVRSITSATDGSGDVMSAMASALSSAGSDLGDAISGASSSLDAIASSTNALFDSVVQGSKDAITQMRTKADQLDGSITAYRQLADTLDSLAPSVDPQYQDMLRAAASTLRSIADSLEHMQSSLRSASDKLESGVQDVEADRQQITQEIESARKNVSELQQEFDGSLKPGLQQLAADAGALASDVSSVLASIGNGTNSLAGTANSANGLLSGATEKIQTFSSELTEASSKLKELSQDLDAALANGSTEDIKRLLDSDVNTLSKALSAPITMERIAVYPVENFGSAMAPFYTTLALFIGSLLIMVVMKPRPPRAVLRKTEDLKPREVYFGHFGIMALISICQSTLMGIGNILLLQVQAVHPFMLMLVLWVAGIVFTFIIYTLVVSFANLGKAIAVLLLIVQVTGCGGSFPLPILPSFVQAFSPFLPATYVVNAMRSAMMGIYGLDLLYSMLGLLAFLIPALLLGLLLRKPMEKFMDWYVEEVEKSQLVS